MHMGRPSGRRAGDILEVQRQQASKESGSDRESRSESTSAAPQGLAATATRGGKVRSAKKVRYLSMYAWRNPVQDSVPRHLSIRACGNVGC